MDQFQPVKDRPESSWIEWRFLMLLLFPEYDFSSSLKPPSKYNTWNSFRNPIFYKAPLRCCKSFGPRCFQILESLDENCLPGGVEPQIPKKSRKSPVPPSPQASTMATHPGVWRWGLFGSWMATIGFTPERSNLSCSASRFESIGTGKQRRSSFFCWKNGLALTMVIGLKNYIDRF